MFKLILNFVLVLAVAAGVAGAADAAAPGDLLYDVDRRIETVQVRLLLDIHGMQALNERFTEERLQEAGQLIDSGSIDVAFDLLEGDSQDSMSLNAIALDETSGDEPNLVEANTGTCQQSATINHPAFSNLANIYKVSLETLIDWHCLGFNISDITKAYAISDASNIPVDILFAQSLEGYTWNEISQAAGLSSFSENPETETLDQSFCNADGTVLLEKEHPDAVKLADKLGVQYAEIMKWFCQGHGFGEIKLAYALSEKSGVNVAEIFNLRSNDVSWGEIIQQVGIKDKTKDDSKTKPPKDLPEKPVKTEKPEKP